MPRKTKVKKTTKKAQRQKHLDFVLPPPDRFSASPVDSPPEPIWFGAPTGFGPGTAEILPPPNDYCSSGLSVDSPAHFPRTYDEFIKENYSPEQRLDLEKACQEERREIEREQADETEASNVNIVEEKRLIRGLSSLTFLQRLRWLATGRVK